MHQYFEQLKRNLEPNDSFDETVSQRHLAIRSALENLVRIHDTKLIGSLQRRTRIQPRTEDTFDIDILVVLGSFVNWLPAGQGISADQALNQVMSGIEESERYSKKDPTEDAPTITLHFEDDIKVELVPAYIDNIGVGPDGSAVPPVGRGYWVPGPGKRWIHADYDFDADYVSRINRANANRVIPLIKMLKAAKRHNFAQLKSFPLEILTTQIVPALLAVMSQQGRHGVPDSEFIKLFFIAGKEMLSSPLTIPGSNSPAVVLDPATVTYLQGRFADVVAHINATERLTSETGKAQAWRQLFGEAFPARATAAYV